MHDINDLFPSKWLRASDLAGDTPATIASVTQEEIGQDRTVKPVVSFRERDLKPMVLNKTNAQSIARVLGTGSVHDWRGRMITLYPTLTEMQGKRVDCIRVREDTGRRAIEHQAPQHRLDKPRTPGGDDHIPF